MPVARARSTASWSLMSRVRIALSPGSGASTSPVVWSTTQLSSPLTTLPWSLVSMFRLPGVPWR